MFSKSGSGTGIDLSAAAAQGVEPLKDALRQVEEAGIDHRAKVYADELNLASYYANGGKTPLRTPRDAELVYWDATYFLDSLYSLSLYNFWGSK